MARKQESRYIQYYVGTAAPKLLPQQPKKNKTKLPQVYKQQSYTVHVDPLALGGILVSVVMLILMAVGMFTLDVAQKELKAATESVDTLQSLYLQLEEKYHSRYELDEVREAALGLGMIPMEEARHITISVPEETAQENTLWESINIFLEGLFA
jgi:hypothetical protein